MKLEELEVLRKKLKKKKIIILIISLILTITVGFFIKNTEFYMALIFVFVFSYIIGNLFTLKDASEYKKGFKDYFVLSSFKKLFTDINYYPEKGLSRDVIASTHMMDMGDRYSSNDYLTAKYKDINFTQADVHIERKEETTDSEGHTRTYYVTIFKGRWMIFDFNKSFKADIQVAQKGFGNNVVKGGLFAKKEEKFKKVEMESQEFNKMFKVYAQSEHDAFYILTPQLMEKISALTKNSKAKMLFCFINNRLHVGLYDGKDSFEAPSVFKKIDEEKERSKIETDVKKITMFVDELKLDNDLFRKEV